MSRNDYEVVIGLEVHAELSTKTKIFCSCPTSFGAAPNTHTCPICKTIFIQTFQKLIKYHNLINHYVTMVM